MSDVGFHDGKFRAPANPPSRTRKVMPAPFARPRIDLDGAGQVNRDWQVIPVHQVAKGDTVPGVGLVYDVHERHAAPDAGTELSVEEKVAQISWTVTLSGGDLNVRTYPGDTMVLCFTAVEKP